MVRDLIAILLLAGLTFSAYLHEQPMYFSGTLLAGYVAGILLRERNDAKRKRFINQLKSCRKQLRQGGTVVIDEMLVRYDSSFTTYRLNIGGLIASVEVKSQYRLSTVEDHRESLLYSLGTLLTGWWSVPFGPIVTLGIVTLNFKKRDTISAAMLLDGNVLLRQNEVQRRISLIEQADIKTKSIELKRDIINTGAGSSSQRLIPMTPTFKDRVTMQCREALRRLAHDSANLRKASN